MTTDAGHRVGLILRRATARDSQRLMDWRNDPVAVSFSVTGQAVGHD